MKTTALALPFLLAACASYAPPLQTEATQAHAGYQVFCENYDCSADTQGQDRIVLTSKVMDAMQKGHVAQRERWTVKDDNGDTWVIANEGDCEDYALTLRDKLRSLYPDYASAFNIATLWTEDDQYHAVLAVHIVKMEGREAIDSMIVCDIRYPQCAPYNTFQGYRYDLVQTGDVWGRVQ